MAGPDGSWARTYLKIKTVYLRQIILGIFCSILAHVLLRILSLKLIIVLWENKLFRTYSRDLIKDVLQIR